MTKFQRGDKAKIVSGAGTRYLNGFTDGETVDVRSGADDENDYKVRSITSGHIGYAQPENLAHLDKPAYQRRTFRLIKDLPGYTKGDLFQEQCDDGTQPYSVFGYDNLDVKLELSNRSLVEDNPQWFVEVFKVTPEYMTRDELDQWEAFKASQATKTKRAAVKRVVKAKSPKSAAKKSK